MGMTPPTSHLPNFEVLERTHGEMWVEEKTPGQRWRRPGFGRLWGENGLGGNRTVPYGSQLTYANFALLFLSFSGDGHWPFCGVDYE